MKNLSIEESIRILGNNYIGHLAFISQGNPYVVPVTYYYDQGMNCIIGYSAEGHKINAMRINPSVSLGVDEIETVGHWQSALAHGTFEEIRGSEARYQLHQFAQGVKSIIAGKQQKVPEFVSEFSSRMDVRGVSLVYRIKILEITGKRRTT